MKLPRLNRKENLRVRFYLFLLKIFDPKAYKRYTERIEDVLKAEELPEEKMDYTDALYEYLEEGDAVISLDTKQIGKVVKLMAAQPLNDSRTLIKEVKVLYNIQGYYKYEICQMPDLGKVLDVTDDGLVTYLRACEDGLITETTLAKQKIDLAPLPEDPLDPHIVEPDLKSEVSSALEKALPSMDFNQLLAARAALTPSGVPKPFIIEYMERSDASSFLLSLDVKLSNGAIHTLAFPTILARNAYKEKLDWYMKAVLGGKNPSELPDMLSPTEFQGYD